MSRILRSKKAIMAASAHRKNEDGTWDSICLGCFLTIARAKNEGELREQERKHACVPLEMPQLADHPRSDHDAA